jgi:uncharacterized protein YraI
MGLSLLCITSLLSGCSFQADAEALTTPTLSVTTSKLAPTLTPRPSDSLLQPVPSSQPTVHPVDGITSTQVNVRAEPSTASTVLGVIPQDMRVEIIGRDPGGNWWQILYPQGAYPEGKGWVTAEFITTVSKPEVPTIGGSEADSNSGTLAVIQEKINIRSGPGTEFDSIGTLDPGDAVTLIGKDADGTWLQIEFTVGPEGKGWISAAFVQVNGVEKLPILTDVGLVVGTGTPTAIPLTPIPTIVPAWEDNDSSANPIMNVTFDPTRTQVSIYNGDVSAPEGDAQDWVQFTPYSQTILLDVSCKGSDLDIEILQNGPAVQPMEVIDCGSKLIVHVEPNQPIKIRFTAHSDGSLSYTSYTLHLKTIP